jgi:asparagine synthase (glutamine-hydrolysing)
MCGIAGFYRAREAAADCELHSMVEALSHRGPDGRSTSVKEDIGLGATRLSLLDAQHGGQPMEDGDLAVVFNGEIYNHHDLREELRRAGATFVGRSDTEVLLRGFRQWGSSLFDKLEGMFAIAIRAGRILSLARDPFGMKPLVYWVSPDSQTLLFASEIKALLRCFPQPRRLDSTGLVEQLVFGHTLGSRTLIADVRHLEPGARLVVERRHGRLLVTPSKPAPSRRQACPRSVPEAAGRLAEALRESVAERLQADHPVATFLSGGIDSTLVAALRSDRAGSRSFVVADGRRVADVRYARRAAAALGLCHEEILITRTPPLSWVRDAVTAMEAPVAPSLALLSAPTVRRTGKAALCGEGADELFAGYRMHHKPELFLLGFEERMRKLRAAAVNESALATTAARIASLRIPEPAARFGAVYEFLLRETMPNKHLAIWDRGAMAASLEVRMPYLDREIRDLALSLPHEWLSPRKELITAVARRLLPRSLAALISRRRKAAAPDALRATRNRLQGLIAAAIPPSWLRKHPLRAISSSPHVLVMLDLFFLGFIAWDGRFPESLAIETMYARHERALRSAHEAACDALFGRRGATA